MSRYIEMFVHNVKAFQMTKDALARTNIIIANSNVADNKHGRKCNID